MTAISTLADWLHYWLESYIRPSCKPAGYAQYRDIVDKHVVPAVGTVPLAELTTGILQQFLNREAACGNRKTGGPLSAKSVKNMRVVLDVALKCAVQEGRLSANPVPGTVIRKVQRKAIEPMSDAMQAALELFLFQDGNLQNPAGAVHRLPSGRDLCFALAGRGLVLPGAASAADRQAAAPQSAAAGAERHRAGVQSHQRAGRFPAHRGARRGVCPAGNAVPPS